MVKAISELNLNHTMTKDLIQIRPTNWVFKLVGWLSIVSPSRGHTGYLEPINVVC